MTEWAIKILALIFAILMLFVVVQLIKQWRRRD